MVDISFSSDIASRAKAAFLGFAVGDALGAPVEFMTPSEIKAKYGTLREMVGGGWLRLKPGQVTDDTEMSLCVARAIADNGWSVRAIAENFAGWLKSKPIDVGDTCRRGIRNFILKDMLETPFNQWDAGNGALMRMVPVALATVGDNDRLERWATEQGHLTHNHPLSDAACICYGKLIHLALQGRSKTRLRREAETLFTDYPTFRFEPYRGLATGYVVDTFQTVLHHFFRCKNFEECVAGAVNQGGDADTTGAIIGGLAGAYYGMDGIPLQWLKKIDKSVADELAKLSAKLLTYASLPS